jgi:hypothetical protein
MQEERREKILAGDSRPSSSVKRNKRMHPMKPVMNLLFRPVFSTSLSLLYSKYSLVIIIVSLSFVSGFGE